LREALNFGRFEVGTPTHDRAGKHEGRNVRANDAQWPRPSGSSPLAISDITPRLRADHSTGEGEGAIAGSVGNGLGPVLAQIIAGEVSAWPEKGAAFEFGEHGGELRRKESLRRTRNTR
jgi:hypothetical protein